MQFATLQAQLVQLQDTYTALTGLVEPPTVISTEIEDELNGLLDQEFGDILAAGSLGRSRTFVPSCAYGVRYEDRIHRVQPR